LAEARRTSGKNDRLFVVDKSLLFSNKDASRSRKGRHR
jgi:hypothetical protein